MTLKTIKKTAAQGPLSEYRLRLMLKQKQLPGVYSGNRFLVDVEMLNAMLAQEAMKNMEDRMA